MLNLFEIGLCSMGSQLVSSTRKREVKVLTCYVHGRTALISGNTVRLRARGATTTKKEDLQVADVCRTVGWLCFGILIKKSALKWGSDTTAKIAPSTLKPFVLQLAQCLMLCQTILTQYQNKFITEYPSHGWFDCHSKSLPYKGLSQRLGKLCSKQIIQSPTTKKS